MERAECDAEAIITHARRCQERRQQKGQVFTIAAALVKRLVGKQPSIRAVAGFVGRLQVVEGAEELHDLVHAEIKAATAVRAKQRLLPRRQFVDEFAERSRSPRRCQRW